MARPKKPVDYEAEFALLEGRKQKLQNSIKEVDEQIRALRQRQEQAEISKLYELYKSSGLSVDDVKSLIQKSSDRR